MNKKLKKKYYREFLSYFRYLKNAGLILSNDFYKQRMEQMTQEISEIVNIFITQGAALLKNVINETERNLYIIVKEDREIYLTGILKDFVNIAPYLNYGIDKEYINEFGKRAVKIGDKTFPDCIDDCHKLIIKHELKQTEHFDDLTIPQQYIISCYRVYRDFFNRLDAMCIDFDIDMLEIQHKTGLQIWQRSNMHSIKKSEEKSNEKDFLSQQKETEPVNKKSADTMCDNIESAFGWMKEVDPRKHEIILKDKDYSNLVEWVAYYFDNNFSLPKIDQPIKIINTAKGNVVYTFMKFFKDEYPSHTRPDSLFKLIKACFYEYREDKIINLKKTKKPQFYSDLINKNK